MNNIIIGIEGMVGAGKTSICKELINIIPNSIFVDASEIYRGIACAAIQSGLNITDIKNNCKSVNPIELMKKLKVEFQIENKCTEIYINGRKISKELIGNTQNSIVVSLMAANSNNEDLYNFARQILDNYKQKFNIIFSARDILTIYPKLDCHVYIIADFDERVKRRYNQYNGKYSIEEIQKIISERDKLHEQSGFNKTNENSIIVDVTKYKNEKESAQKVYEQINKFINNA